MVLILLYSQQMAAPRGQVDEQPMVGKLVTVPVEYAVVLVAAAGCSLVPAGGARITPAG